MSSLDVSPLGSADITSKQSFPSSLPVNNEMEVRLTFKPSFSDNNEKYILTKIKVKLSFELKSGEKRNRMANFEVSEHKGQKMCQSTRMCPICLAAPPDSRDH